MLVIQLNEKINKVTKQKQGLSKVSKNVPSKPIFEIAKDVPGNLTAMSVPEPSENPL